MPQSLRLFRYSELRAACDEFSQDATLGNGGLGDVFKCILNREVFAVKKLHAPDSQGMAALIQELRVLSCVRHQNLLPLVGFAADFDGQCLVFPLMPSGSLRERLRDSFNQPISSMQRVLIGTVLQCASPSLPRIHRVFTMFSWQLRERAADCLRFTAGS